jgi:hypothetical protein
VLRVLLVTVPYKPPLVVRICPDCNSVSCLLRNRIFVCVSEPCLITRAATAWTRLPGGPRLTDITLCLLFSFVVTQPNWKAVARRTAWPLWGRFWSRNATQLSVATYSTVIHCSRATVGQRKYQVSQLIIVLACFLDLAIRYECIFANNFVWGTPPV